MSTLSELIPSGGTQNNIEFVAQGTLANGQAVALRSDGKVEAISETSASNGSAVQFSTGNYAEEILSFPIPSTSQIVVAYQEAGIDNSFKAVVGTITGTAIVFSSSPIAVSGGVAVTWIAGCFETGESKVVFAWTNNSNKLVALGGSVSGTGSSATISLGSESLISTSQISNNVFLQDNPAASGKTQFIYRDQSASDTKVLTLSINSSNTIGTGQATTITSTSYPRGVGPATEDDKSILVDSPNGGNLVLYVGSYNSGADTWSFNTSSPVALNSGDTFFYNNPVVVANNFIGVAFTNASGYPTVNSFTLSGTTLTAGTPLVLASNGVGRNGFAYDATASKYVFAYRNTSTAAGLYHTINFSGTAFTTASSAIQFVANAIDVSVAYNASQGKTIFSFSDGGDSEKGKGQVYELPVSTATSFVGITNAAISSGATGEVAVKGGLSTTADLGTFTPSFSTPVRYTTSNSAAPACSVCYDTTNDRYVMFYTDSTNSNYGYATVGTYSSGTTTWGTPVAVNSVNSSNVKAVFDASQGKVLFVYTNGSDSSKLVSAVGTVSGTSISVGSAVTMSASLTSTSNTSVTYDANVNRSLVLTRVGSDSSKVYASVVSISGTTPTFNGTAVLTGTLATTQNIASCFDPDTNKVAAFVYDANASTTSGYVVTVSASSFSTSAGLNIGIGEALGMLSEYSTVANQVLVFVKPSAVTASQARTFTVAATLSASSGWVNVTSSATASTLAIAEDVSKGVIVLAGQDEISGAQGKVSLATISGASLTVTTATVFQASAANPATAVYNPDSSNVLIGYRNGSTYGTSAIVSVASDTLTIGSNYFVQDDGSLATTSSSNKAGKAISTTALNLVDPT